MRAHVGLNLIYLVPDETGGMETYAGELLRPGAGAAVAPELRLTAFVNREAHVGERRALGCVRPRCRRCRSVHATELQWVRGEQELLPRLASRAGVDLVHSLCACTAPAWGRFRRVSTIHSSPLPHRS